MEKMTKREMYEFIANAMGGNDEVVAFCKHEIELLARKSEKASGSKTATQKANEVLIEQIYSALELVNRPVTLTELQTEVPALASFSNQKLSALMKSWLMRIELLRSRISASPCSLSPRVRTIQNVSMMKKFLANL